MRTSISDPTKLRALIDREARAAGFDAVAVTAPDAIPMAPARLAEFVDAGFHGSMGWIAETLERFPNGVYFSDVYFNERVQHPAVIAFGALLSAFVKGRMHMHFKTPQEMARIMTAAGFKRVRAIKTEAIKATREYAQQRGGDSVRVLEAWV